MKMNEITMHVNGDFDITLLQDDSAVYLAIDQIDLIIKHLKIEKIKAIAIKLEDDEKILAACEGREENE